MTAKAWTLPETPVGRRLDWWLAMIAEGGANTGPEDRGHYHETLQHNFAALFDPATGREAWARDAGRLGAPVAVSTEASDETTLTAVYEGSNGRKFTLTVAVEPEPPHRIASFRIERKHDFHLDVREATPADALTVADIERRCPIVMGETSTWFDRGAAYFDFARLMEDCTVGLASVDGIPAAVSCGARHRIRVGGELKTTVTYSHLRVLPEHQRKGLWGAANSVLRKYDEGSDGTSAYISVDNLVMQHGFAGNPDKWPQIVQRVELDCAALAGPDAGRPATPDDAADLVRRLNAFHGPEEIFVPYTEASLAARMQRAPDLYSWDKVLLTDSALVGVWAAGQALKSVTETRGEQRVTVPAVVLDYAFEPGAEGQLEALLRAWSGRLARAGIDTLALYTSPASAGTEALCALARTTGDFFMWTPGIRVPAGAETRGLYVDAIYF